MTKANVGKDKVTLTIEAGGRAQTVEAEKVLMAAGRGGQYREHRVQRSRSGTQRPWLVKVNLATLETTAPGGVLHRRPWRTADAGAQGEPRGNCRRRIDCRAQAAPDSLRQRSIRTYCHPEVASIGLTEEQCKEKKLDYQVGRFPFSANGRARATNETEGFVKIIRDKKYGEILGAHIVGGPPSEMIHELVVARENEYTVEEIDLAIPRTRPCRRRRRRQSSTRWAGCCTSNHSSGFSMETSPTGEPAAPEQVGLAFRAMAAGALAGLGAVSATLWLVRTLQDTGAAPLARPLPTWWRTWCCWVGWAVRSSPPRRVEPDGADSVCLPTWRIRHGPQDSVRYCLVTWPVDHYFQRWGLLATSGVAVLLFLLLLRGMIRKAA